VTVESLAGIRLRWSRRQLLQRGALAFGGLTGAGLLEPALTLGRPAPGAPRPIPGGFDENFVPVPSDPFVHILPPGIGFEMSTITDFKRRGRRQRDAWHGARHRRQRLGLRRRQAVGVLEIAGGAALLLGVVLRPVALALAGNTLGAIVVSGILRGQAVSLTLAPALLTAMIALLVHELRQSSVVGSRRHGDMRPRSAAARTASDSGPAA
jgi:uncharacterized membrane protein YphA (DoxX/SURF4 family)